MNEDSPQDNGGSGGGAEQGSARHRQSKPRRKRKRARRPPRASVIANTISDINRLRQIATVLTRHGFSQFIRGTGLEAVLSDVLDEEELSQAEQGTTAKDARSMARRFRMVLEDLGPTFIKFGQILSTRPDLLPQTWIKEFEKLQDQVPPMPLADVRRQIESGLAAPLDEIFETFDEEALATASIGQVHRATTSDGQEVVVKVLRPGISQQIRADLELLRLLARLLEATIAEMSIYSVRDIIGEFERAISQEIDFHNEAKNIEHFRRAFADHPHIVIPEIHHGLSCGTVLTLSWLSGHKLSELDPGTEEAGRIVDILLEATYQQIFDHGVFHGDPHPGNILVLGPDKIGLIDFGLVGRLSRAQQDDLVTLFITILIGDVDGIARTILRIGYPQDRISLTKFKREIATVRDKYLNLNLGEVDVSAFTSELMDAAMRYQIKLNSEYSLLVKTTVTLEGILRRVNPNLDLLGTATPYARRLILERYSSKRILQNVFTGAMSLSGFLQDVPAQLDQVLMDLESGRVAVNVKHEEFDKIGSHVAVLGTRLSLGLVSCGLAVGASVMLAQLDYRPWDIPLLLFVAIGFMATSIGLSLVALFWAVMLPKARRLRLTPLVRLFRRRRKRR